MKATVTGIGVDGNPIKDMHTAVIDGMPHPRNDPNCDAIAATWVDTDTLIDSRTKAGKLVGTQTSVVSPDGKTLTVTTLLIDANGRPFNNTLVFDKYGDGCGRTTTHKSRSALVCGTPRS
jgi:hypothetical protein